MAGLLDYVFNSPEGRMGLGLFALGQMPKSQGMQGLMGPWHRRMKQQRTKPTAHGRKKPGAPAQRNGRRPMRRQLQHVKRAAEQQSVLAAPGLGGTSAPAVQVCAGAIPAGGVDVGAQGGKN